ncbi:hypothetical protein IB211_00028 [Intestinimonas butyriciproducens]|uniref:Uncharacterized protein n=1 Tax=Intestinimonas butyriciproducens TaxID=1297617 RepID=A0A0S2VZA1_9FIRM|nr:hypothetical protein IB211_00028 [Intestinimonas butyriciproducens]QBB64292.1 hypothetical protein SRB521_00028 [Intestinimonas butyriciproducens]
MFSHAGLSCLSIQSANSIPYLVADKKREYGPIHRKFTARFLVF